MTATRSDALVFFGATGDLAAKQIFPALQALVRRKRLDGPVVAVGRKAMSKDEIIALAKKSLTEHGGVDEAAFGGLSEKLRYVAIDFDDASTFARIREALGDARHPLHYVALPPDVFEQVAKGLAAAGLAEGARLVLEKPFGHDAESAKALSAALHPHFPEESIFRIDHFLGKEPVENIVYFRAANPLFEAVLTNQHVQSVQITMAETFGVEGRAAFYDGVGAIRDVVQNHLLELIACLTLELPDEPGHAGLRAARARVLTQLQTLSPNDIVRGQVKGYAKEKGVKDGSTTETFAVLRLALENDRWRGVPFFLRAGKSLPVTATEAVVTFKPSRKPVLEETASPPPNRLTFRLGSEASIAIASNVKKDGESLVGTSKELALHLASPDALKPYDRLLGDAMNGDASFFASKEAAEESWRIVDPVIGDVTPAHAYEKGTWGPAEAAKIAPEGGWLDPR